MSISLVTRALDLARQLQTRANELQLPAERRQQAELGRMMQSPADKATLVQMTDQAFRSQSPGRSVDQLIHVLDVQGVPRFFSPLDQTLLRGFQSFGGLLPGVALPLVKEHMQQETANVVLPAEQELLREHLLARRAEGVRMNVNYLGEAMLGEREAARRLEIYLTALAQPEIEVISVKISTIYSQISALAREHTVSVLCDRLETLYRAAVASPFVDANGVTSPKLVYLDMEEYRDLELTVAALMQTLDRPGLERVRAGVVLQAYLPDSFAIQQRVTEWARRRVAAGAEPLTLRIVKGANMEMERVEASLRCWSVAPYQQKFETDANYLRMLHYGLRSENIAAVRLGIASHNLFTLAYGLTLTQEANALPRVQFEMLEGMANHLRRAIHEVAPQLLLYAPVCRHEDFLYAVGYLVRRLDENTGPDNFLRHAFNLVVDSADWRRLENHFLAAIAAMETVSSTPRRTQNRNTPNHQTSGAPRLRHSAPFANEPDTDFSLVANGEWAEQIVERWKPRHTANAAEVTSIIAGAPAPSETLGESIDPSRPDVIVARYTLATSAQVDEAVACAVADPTGWRRRTPRERSELLFRTAEELASARGDLLGAMLAEGGKLLTEGDPEISEAIDFCRYYAQSAEEWYSQPGLAAQPRGVVAVVPPWNFPLAIPCGGVAAALAAGNTVILKPATNTVLIAQQLCECFWRAGVPREALQFVPTSGGSGGAKLVSHPGVNAVILTGGTETAQRMLAAKPTLKLFAETGGKNATIVTAIADRDLAIKNVLHSAFSHSGQKCSATSLLILEDEVFHDQKFKDALVDAVESMTVGSAWNLATKLGPVIRPPSGELLRGLTQLDASETWLVPPHLAFDGNPCLIGPAIKWNVAPRSFTHCIELFGPVLGVMRARNLHEAIDLVNATGFGLTSGLESLDDREHDTWQSRIRAGNLYLNRSTTGAIVRRQPFGGMGKSSVGPGIKAGGPNYVAQFMEFDVRGQGSGVGGQGSSVVLDDDHPLAALVALADAADRQQLIAAIHDYTAAAASEFHVEHDPQLLLGEDNLRRYLPVAALRVRLNQEDTWLSVLLRIAAARTMGCRVVVSRPPELPATLALAIAELDLATDAWAADIEFVTETDDQLAAALLTGQTDRIRFASPERVPNFLRTTAARCLAYLADEPVSPIGRLELLWYAQEQCYTRVYHRYGNLGVRADEVRSPVL
jgi:RHH-type transcriptional regulator, proline utilization regulon repressor / proline dehydrogenase / delta 1-pyrroline-5-carboxylate dehydrogenase